MNSTDIEHFADGDDDDVESIVLVALVYSFIATY